jgi:hypothetical protein
MKNPLTPMDEGIANVFCPMPAPAALREALLKAARRADRQRRRMRHFALAASFLLGALGLGLWLTPTPDPGLDFARQAVLNHTTVTHMDFQGAPPDGQAACGTWSMAKLGYQAPLPVEFTPSQVAGGRTCSLKSRPVAYYQMTCGSGLFVFKEPVKELEKRCPSRFSLPNGYTARVWNEHERGYLLVEAGDRRP